MKETVQIFKALSEEIRLRILALLFHGELCVCDLMEVLEIPQSTISRHLAYLRNAGLVTGERRGKWMYYRLASNAGKPARALLDLLAENLPQLSVINQDHCRLVTYLAGKNGASCTDK
ncbi:MAG TPA: ArsR family transcriptional regulator [Desulfobulbus sp.]|nr:ArsR family transcriptional regulator [Desulfobulbus sp.]